jgi:Xaa-Pro aminopeptidase
MLTRSPVADAKAIKNETELEGFRRCHIRDGVALVSFSKCFPVKVIYLLYQARYFAWLEEVLNNNEKISESQAASKLEEYRSYVHSHSSLSHLNLVFSFTYGN